MILKIIDLLIDWKQKTNKRVKCSHYWIKNKKQKGLYFPLCHFYLFLYWPSAFMYCSLWSSGFSSQLLFVRTRVKTTCRIQGQTALSPNRRPETLGLVDPIHRLLNRKKMEMWDLQYFLNYNNNSDSKYQPIRSSTSQVSTIQVMYFILKVFFLFGFILKN